MCPPAQEANDAYRVIRGAAGTSRKDLPTFLIGQHPIQRMTGITEDDISSWSLTRKSSARQGDHPTPGFGRGLPKSKERQEWTVKL